MTLTRQNLLEDRESSAFAVAGRNASIVQGRVTDDTGLEDVEGIFDSLTIAERSFPLLRIGDVWSGARPQIFNQDSLPPELLAEVANGNAAQMRVRIDGEPIIVIGIPIPRSDVDYFEAASTADVEQTLSLLGFVVTGASLASLLASAILGAVASRRVLRPLADVRVAAESIAAGELDTRLTPPADADLASLISSFNGMARTLEDRIERDERFASEVSHELRSPLMTLNASIEVLNNSRAEMSERNQIALDLLGDDVSRFTVLVEDLLEMSRYDVGTAALQAEPINIAEFVRQIVTHAPHLAVLRDTATDAALVMGDKRRLAQVVSNLIDNASKYGEGSIEVVVGVLGENAMIAVEDEGPGVPETERKVIFDRFSRGSEGGRRGQGTGSGLGLALVAEHVGLHGGRVWVEDRPDGRSGARFVALIPLAQPEDLEDKDNQW